MAELKSFDRVAHVYDQTRGLPPEAERAIADGIAAALGDAKNLLEVGIGTGRMAAPLAARGVHVTGIDISAAMLAVLRGKRTDIDVILAEGARPPFRAGSFDAALFVHILHLVPDAQATVRAALRVVRPGGLLVSGADDWSREGVRDQADRIIREAVNEATGVEMSGWSVDPYGAKFEDGWVWGMGAHDDKGGVVACLLAARQLQQDGGDLEALGVAFAFPVDEERDGAGSRALALAVRPRYAIALEATGLATGIAEIGDVEAVVHVHGRSAHGALGALGDNAIDRAVAFVNALPELGLGDHAHPLLGASSFEVGGIAAGAGHNAIPDRCSVKVAIKVVPGQGSRAVVDSLDRLAAAHGARVELVEVTDPFETPSDSPLVAALDVATAEVAGEPRPPIGVPAWTDAHNFVTFGGAEAVVFGPGDFATAHTPEEHVDARRVVECGDVFVRVASRGWRS